LTSCASFLPPAKASDAHSTKEIQAWFRPVTIPQLFPSTVEEFFRAFEMKAFKHRFRVTCGADHAMAAAIAITFAMIAASAHLRSIAQPRESPPYGLHRFEGYRGPRA
jgi:hypothetical protein